MTTELIEKINRLELQLSLAEATIFQLEEKLNAIYGTHVYYAFAGSNNPWCCIDTGTYFSAGDGRRIF